MATASSASPAGWLRIVALVAVVWNLFGLAMYLSSVGVFGDPTADMTGPELAAVESIPSWITGAFAIGAFAGLIGSVGLLLRKAWAQPLLVVSMIALLILEGWIVFFSGALEVFGLVVPVAVSACAILLVWVAMHAKRRGLLS